MVDAEGVQLAAPESVYRHAHSLHQRGQLALVVGSDGLARGLSVGLRGHRFRLVAGSGRARHAADVRASLNEAELRRWGMSFSESEIVALMAIAVVLNGLGLVAWRGGLLGHWYPIAIVLSMLALLADPMSLPGVASAGAIAAMLLGSLGLAVSVRHRKGGAVGAASR